VQLVALELTFCGPREGPDLNKSVARLPKTPKMYSEKIGLLFIFPYMTTSVRLHLVFVLSRSRCSTSKHYGFQRVLPNFLGGQ